MKTSHSYKITQAGLIGLFGLGVIFAITYKPSVEEPRQILLERYQSVESITVEASFKCNAGRNRRTFQFTARDKQGARRNGYLCYTPGPQFLAPEPVIHENIS